MQTTGKQFFQIILKHANKIQGIANIFPPQKKPTTCKIGLQSIEIGATKGNNEEVWKKIEAASKIKM